MIAETRKSPSLSGADPRAQSRIPETTAADVAAEPNRDGTVTQEHDTKKNPRSADSPVHDATGSHPDADSFAVEPSPARPPRASGRRSSPWRWVLVAAALGLVALIAVRLIGGRGASMEGQMGGPTPVRAAAVALGELDIFSSYSGELVGEVSDISPRVGGLLQEVPVRIGDRVARGAVLAVVDDVNLRNQFQEAKGQHGVAVANQRRAAAELESVQADHKRAEGLYRESLLSEQEFERVGAQLASSRAGLAASEAQTAQAEARLALLEQQLQDSRVIAPFAGTVSARYLDRGVMVQPGTPILRLVEAAPLLVQFRVPERDLGAMRPGAAFSVATQATRETFAGTVRRVSGEVSRTDRTVIVEGELQENAGLLKPGMYADVQVRLRALEGALLVPDVALLERVTMSGEQATGVMRVESGDAVAGGSEGSPEAGSIARWTPVEVIGRSGGLAAIEGGIAKGDLVLTLGHTELQDGAPVRVVVEQSVDALSPGEATGSGR